MRSLDLLGKYLLIVVAHPDDETFLCAGLMDKNRASGGRHSLVCATYGEKGKSHMPMEITEGQLKQIRKKELAQVCKLLSVKKVFGLGLPDGGLSVHSSKLLKAIFGIAKTEKPDYIVSFGSDGISGHLDHVSIGTAARKIAESLNIPFVAFAASPAFQAHFYAVKSRRKHGVYSKHVVHKPHTLKLKISTRLKKQAYAFHKSQSKNGDPFFKLTPEVIYQFLHYEYFRA